jgi:DNA polymerase-3 subunit alpha
MRKYLKDLKPNSFEDLIAMVSLYRPGPLAYIPTYIERKHGEKVEYMTTELYEILKKKYTPDEIEHQKQKLEQDLKKILDVTYGVAVYQEQLMFIVQYMAGFSL